MPDVITGSVAFRHVSKVFGTVVANDDVSFEVRAGSFHALLGENGAGKTTLMRVLAGELKPSQGTVVVSGEECVFRSPRHARNRGIRMVHQHSILIPNLSIAENFVLDEVGGATFTDFRTLCATLEAKFEEFGLQIDPRQKVWALSTTQRQWVEVFRALQGDGRIVILDEPTALLSPIEGDALLDKLKALTTTGVSVILITHKLREVFTFADAVTVLRKGRWVATSAVSDETEAGLAAMMVGAGTLAEDPAERPPRPAAGQKLIEVSQLVCKNRRGRRALNSVSFSLSRGEVLGVAGISGNGQSELAQVVAGVEQPVSGSVRDFGDRTLIRRYIPDDRINVATAANLSVRDNLALRAFRRFPYANRGFLNSRAIDGLVSSRIRQFKINTPSADLPVKSCSGGNIQRVVIARELQGELDLVVAHNPTAGLDIATSAFVRRCLVKVAAGDGGVLLISDDLDELLAVADRILVLHSGAVAGTVDRAMFDRVAIASLMSGAQGVRVASREQVQ